MGQKISKYMRPFALAFLLLFAAGCQKYQDVKVSGVKSTNLNVESFSEMRVDAVLEVENPSHTPIDLKDVTGTVRKSDAPFAEFVLVEPVTIPSGGTCEVPVSIRFRLSDGKTLLRISLNLLSLSAKDFTVDAQLQLKAGMFSKTLEFKDLNAEELMSIMKK